jgi:YD repeat-containing protein
MKRKFVLSLLCCFFLSVNAQNKKELRASLLRLNESILILKSDSAAMTNTITENNEIILTLKSDSAILANAIAENKATISKNMAEIEKLKSLLISSRDSVNVLFGKFKLKSDSLTKIKLAAQNIIYFLSNNSGKIYKESKYNEIGKLISNTIYQYNYYGNVRKKVTNEIDDTTTWKYSYDKKGNLLQEIITDRYGNSTVDYIYHNNGQINYSRLNSEIMDYDERFKREKYEYNSKGSLLSIKGETEHDGPYGIEYTYDNTGLVLLKKTEGNKYQRFTEFEYNKRGYKSREIFIDDGPEIVYIKDFNYDNEGKLLQSLRSKSYSLKYIFDSYGMLVDRQFIGLDKDKDKKNIIWEEKTKYEYDLNDNLILATVYSEDGKCIEKRKTEYFLLY